MLTYEILSDEFVGTSISTDVIVEKIERIVSDFGLIIHRKMTLASYKGSIHYHVVKPSERGVLEITYWPKEFRLWLDIADNRRALWNLAVIEDVCLKFAEIFVGRVVPR